jgi:hypothetical protein
MFLSEKILSGIPRGLSRRGFLKIVGLALLTSCSTTDQPSPTSQFQQTPFFCGATDRKSELEYLFGKTPNEGLQKSKIGTVEFDSRTKTDFHLRSDIAKILLDYKQIGNFVNTFAGGLQDPSSILNKDITNFGLKSRFNGNFIIYDGVASPNITCENNPKYSAFTTYNLIPDEQNGHAPLSQLYLPAQSLRSPESPRDLVSLAQGLGTELLQQFHGPLQIHQNDPSFDIRRDAHESISNLAGYLMAYLQFTLKNGDYTDFMNNVYLPKGAENLQFGGQKPFTVEKAKPSEDFFNLVKNTATSPFILGWE